MSVYSWGRGSSSWQNIRPWNVLFKKFSLKLAQNLTKSLLKKISFEVTQKGDRKSLGYGPKDHRAAWLDWSPCTDVNCLKSFCFYFLGTGCGTEISNNHVTWSGGITPVIFSVHLSNYEHPWSWWLWFRIYFLNCCCWVCRFNEWQVIHVQHSIGCYPDCRVTEQ